MKYLALFLALLLSSTAEAGECPWGRSPSVASTMTTVLVDGVQYPVRGYSNRLNFENTLTKCGNSRAQLQFRRWRATRRTINTISIISTVVLPLAVIGYPVAIALGISAGGIRQSLMRSISLGSRGKDDPYVPPFSFAGRGLFSDAEDALFQTETLLTLAKRDDDGAKAVRRRSIGVLLQAISIPLGALCTALLFTGAGAPVAIGIIGALGAIGGDVFGVYQVRKQRPAIIAAAERVSARQKKKRRRK